jgi:hypothetical protein
MIACNQANLKAIVKAERPALLHFMQGFHLKSASCDQDGWSFKTREGVTLFFTVKRTHGKRIAAYEDGSAVVATPTGQILVTIRGGIA